MKNYDLAIIGSGPGGYAAGLYASGHKLNVCVIEKDLVGGTCLNRGCIPTKALLNSAALLSAIKTSSVHGIEVGDVRLDFDKVMARKAEVVSRLRTGIETLFRARSIEVIRGNAAITAADTIKIDGSESIKAKYIIIASGSAPLELPNIKFDGRDILSSDGALELKTIPKSIAIIGGGVIGCEFATLFNAFGSKVTMIEFMDRLVMSQSREASKKLELIFKKRGIDVIVSAGAESVSKGSILNIKISTGKSVEAQKVLVAVGRSPSTDALGLEKLGIKIDNGRIAVDEYLRTGLKNIYAVGDCVAGPLLAHKASYDGILACDHILGGARKADYSNVPNCMWTDPELASVGLCEEEAKTKYPDARIAKFPYLASSKAYLMGKSEGFVKIIGSAGGDILGVEIFGAGACDLIGEATLARVVGMNIKDWAHVIHGHPTLSEVLQEASGAFMGTAIYSI